MRVATSPTSISQLARALPGRPAFLLLMVSPLAGQQRRQLRPMRSGKPAPGAQFECQARSSQRRPAEARSRQQESRQEGRQAAASRASGADGAHQAGLCGLDRVAAHGPATGHAAHAGGLCGRDQVRAARTPARRRRRLIWRWATPICWTSATPRRRPTSAWRGRRATELADYADFLGARANHEAGNEAAAEALLHGFAERYPDSIFVAQAPELEANALLAMNECGGRAAGAGCSGRNCGCEPPRLSACAGAGGIRAGADAEGGAASSSSCCWAIR